ncbi:hypothetical protein ACTOB_005832 [Actinoplanes oblitus]|uniref:Uncharacterized protein n=1 Tax=Actinoplanes oblitus TaxID=3040509 RepID=A0ABY8WBR3_9ACTN|nr:hypothetical protein [Actinoplanes oblitus]WIM93839.1 hypothetical protein ACTOB_005832 [Actinoplanes oblitus]
MTDATDEPDARLAPPGEPSGPEYETGGDLEYDEAHGAGDHLDVPAALVEEAERRRTLARG